MSTNTNVKNKPKRQADPKGIPEVFDSSKYNSMAEMKESADMKEGGHLKEVLTNVEKEEPIKPETVNNNKHFDIYTTMTSDASPPHLEEKGATMRGSNEEQITDQNLKDSKDKS
jgi:hypothetical protein